MADPDKESNWFDRPESRRLLWRLLWVACAVSLLADLLVQRPPHFGIDGWLGLYGLLAFVGSAVTILVAKAIGFWIRRGENYYGDHSEDDVIPEDIDKDHAD